MGVGKPGSAIPRPGARRYSRFAIFFISALASLFQFTLSAEAENITVDVTQDLGPVNRAVLGNNMIGYPRVWNEITRGWVSYGYHVGGDGVWNKNSYSSVPEMVKFAKDIGISFSRFPGGVGVRWYNWKDAVGPIAQRPLYPDSKGNKVPITFGLPEFLKNTQDMGAIPVIEVSDYFGTAQDAADLVEYLNAPNDGAHPWAKLRAADGHPEPWGVIWFEYGNETYVGNPATGIIFTPNQYVANYLAYRSAMKMVDSKIKLGAVLEDPGSLKDWSEIVITGTGSVADFYITHSYVLSYTRNDGVPDANSIFSIGLAAADTQLQSSYRRLNDLIFELSGRAIPIAVTEYNSGFVQASPVYPVAYRHTLGNALINAEHIRQLMHADNIVMANYWQFANSYWGMVKGSGASYVLRPNYYPFQFYRNHFGERLIKAQVDGATTYEITGALISNAGGNYGVAPATGAYQAEALDDTDRLKGVPWQITDVNGAQTAEESGTPCEPRKRTTMVETQKPPAPSSNCGQDRLPPEKTAQPQGSHGTLKPGVKAQPFPHAPRRITGFPDPPHATPRSGAHRLTVTFDGSRDVDYFHAQKSATVDPGTWYRLSGYISTERLDSNNGIFLSVGSSNNKLQNSGFENDLTNWAFNPGNPAASGSATTIIDNRISHSGSRSVKVSFYGKNANYYHVSQTVAVRPNTTYLIEGFIKTTNLSTSDKGVSIEVQNANDWRLGAWSTAWLKGTNEWTRVSRVFTTNAYTTKIRVLLRGYGTSGDIKGDAWWDDVKFFNRVESVHLTGSSTSWMPVRVDFRSDDNTTSVPVAIRRIVNGKAVHGAAYFKDIMLQRLTPENYGAVPYLSVNASKSQDGSKAYLMVVNKNMAAAISSTISLVGGTAYSVKSWTLNGPLPSSTNETAQDVTCTYNNVGRKTNGFSYTFPAHSLTALEIDLDTGGDGIPNTNDNCQTVADPNQRNSNRQE